MPGEYDPEFQWLQIETYAPKLIVATRIIQEWNIERTSRTFVGHVNLCLAKSQPTIFRISVGDCVQKPSTESIEVLQRYTIAAQEHVIFVRA
jgi:hypothetical protein